MPVLAVVAAVAALWGLAPALVRWQVQRQVALYWPGEVTIDHVSLHPGTPIELLGVTVRDGAGTAIVLSSVTVAVQELAWNGSGAARLAIRGLTLEAGTPRRPVTLPVTMAGAVTTPYRGTLYLDGWRIDYRDVPIAQEVTAILEPSDSGLSIGGPVGHLLGGQMEVKVHPREGANEAGLSRATVSAHGIPLAQLGPLLPRGEQVTHGTGTLKLELLQRADTGWTIHGLLRVADADLRGVALASKLCHFIGVENLTPLAATQAEIAFDLVGTVATVTRGRLASELPEMAIEPESRIDLATGRIDASVVLAAGATLGELPLLHPVGDLVKSLTRIEIHGHWSDPQETLFSRD